MLRTVNSWGSWAGESVNGLFAKDNFWSLMSIPSLKTVRRSV